MKTWSGLRLVSVAARFPASRSQRQQQRDAEEVRASNASMLLPIHVVCIIKNEKYVCATVCLSDAIASAREQWARADGNLL